MQVLKDIIYGNLSESQKLDLYFPDNLTQKEYPLIFFIHGGGFSSGDKGKGTILDLVKANNPNFVIASINYRLSGEAPFPAGIRDCENAIDFLLSNAKKYHIDSKIAIAGTSSGGNYALMLGLNKIITSKFKNLCIVALYPIVDLLSQKNLVQNLDDDDENKNYSIKNSELYFNKKFSEISDDELKNASPYFMLTENLPSTLLQHGTADDLVPIWQSEKFYEKAVKMGIDIRLDITKDAVHGDKTFKTQQNISRIFDFISSKLI